MTEPRHPDEPNNADAPPNDADQALDHALRERPVDENDEFEYDETADDLSGIEPPVDDGEQAIADDSSDAEDYVLYSEVRPHLEELVILQEQRGKMIDLLLYARDRVSSPAVASRMDDNLSQLGVGVLVPTVGDRFDPAHHEASATVPTTDVTAHGTIAEVELAGYTDGDRMVRPPIVTVYSAERENS